MKITSLLGIPILVAGVAALLIALPGTTAVPESSSGAEAQPAQVVSPVEVRQASISQESLDMLPVKGRAPKTGYSREQFGQAWSDDVTVEFGHNGCDTRNDILRRDLINITLKPGTRDCVVLTGTLQDPYTGESIAFKRGPQSSVVQIDHVVALSNAWQTGAQQLTPEQRRNFANDPLNLRASAGRANQQKGDGDAATWLPSNKAFRCEYASAQVAVKTKYQLWVTAPEKDALARVLAAC